MQLLAQKYCMTETLNLTLCYFFVPTLVGIFLIVHSSMISSVFLQSVKSVIIAFLNNFFVFYHNIMRICV